MIFFIKSWTFFRIGRVIYSKGVKITQLMSPEQNNVIFFEKSVALFNLM